jgi:hypothetical protein
MTQTQKTPEAGGYRGQGKNETNPAINTKIRACKRKKRKSLNEEKYREKNSELASC